MHQLLPFSFLEIYNGVGNKASMPGAGCGSDAGSLKFPVSGVRLVDSLMVVACRPLVGAGL